MRIYESALEGHVIVPDYIRHRDVWPRHVASYLTDSNGMRTFEGLLLSCPVEPYMLRRSLFCIVRMRSSTPLVSTGRDGCDCLGKRSVLPSGLSVSAIFPTISFPGTRWRCWTAFRILRRSLSAEGWAVTTRRLSKTMRRPGSWRWYSRALKQTPLLKL